MKKILDLILEKFSDSSLVGTRLYLLIKELVKLPYCNLIVYDSLFNRYLVIIRTGDKYRTLNQAIDIFSNRHNPLVFDLIDLNLLINYPNHKFTFGSFVNLNHFEFDETTLKINNCKLLGKNTFIINFD